MHVNFETTALLGIILSAINFLMISLLYLLIDRSTRKTIKSLKEKIEGIDTSLTLALQALAAICNVINPVNQEEAVQPSQEKPSGPHLPVTASVRKAAFPKGSSEAKERMAKVREAAAKKKEEEAAAAKEAAKTVKLEQIADLEKKLAALKGE